MECEVWSGKEVVRNEKWEVWSAESVVCSVRGGVSRAGPFRDRVFLSYRLEGPVASLYGGFVRPPNH